MIHPVHVSAMTVVGGGRIFTESGVCLDFQSLETRSASSLGQAAAASAAKSNGIKLRAVIMETRRE